MSTKAVAEIDEKTSVLIDTGQMEKRLSERMDDKLKLYMEQLKTYKPEDKKAKGVVETYVPDHAERKAKLLEEFHKGENCDPKIIKEQWTIAIPAFAEYELAGHLRDYVWVTDVVKGKAGETVNIPYVKDLEFSHVTVKTGAFSGKTGLVSTLTTTLHESGEYYDAYYGDIEKIDSNLLDELNRVFAHAAIRAEDQDLLALLDACTTAQFSDADDGTSWIGGGSRECPDAGTVTGTVPKGDTYFKASLIADALGKMLRKGKEVRPGDCILYMTPRNYQGLMRDIISSTPLAYATPGVVTQGMIENYLGVRIVVGGYKTQHGYHSGHTTYEVCYLMRPKRCLALAPKRDILIETDKLVKTRQLTIAASHTYGVCLLDSSEAVRIWSSYKVG